MTLEDAVRKMTSLPAQRLGPKDRGVIKAGAFADLVVFNPERVHDTASYTEPYSYPVGISHVIVNGKFVVKDGGAYRGNAGEGSEEITIALPLHFDKEDLWHEGRKDLRRFC